MDRELARANETVAYDASTDSKTEDGIMMHHAPASENVGEDC